MIHSKVYKLNTIYSRVIILLSSDCDVYVEDVLAYMSWHQSDEEGLKIRKAETKLKSFQFEVSWRNAGDVTLMSLMEQPLFRPSTIAS